jgi:hypothetical protein
MGGIIAVTIRYSDGKELRTSCWTNVLPEGLFSVDFYDEKASEAHTKKFMTKLLANRKKEKDIEQLWGNWNKLAPVEYGQIVIDYKTSSLVGSQGYCSIDNSHMASNDLMEIEKFLGLHERGLVTWIRNERRERSVDKAELEGLVARARKLITWHKEMREKYKNVDAEDFFDLPREKVPVDLGFIMYGITIPNFKTIIEGMEDKMPEVRAWIEKNFILTPAEKRVWTKWFKDRQDDEEPVQKPKKEKVKR